MYSLTVSDTDAVCKAGGNGSPITGFDTLSHVPESLSLYGWI